MRTVPTAGVVKLAAWLGRSPKRYVDFLRRPRECLEAIHARELNAHLDDLLNHSLLQVHSGLDTAILRVTDRCPLRCVHCSVAASPNVGRVAKREAVFQMLDELIAMKVRTVKLTGGEPLAWPGCLETVRHAAQAGVHMEIETSAVPLRSSFLQAVEPYREQVSFAVGFDSRCRETYEAFRNKPGSFAKVSAALELLKAGGFRVKIMTVLSRLNQTEVPELIQWTLETFGEKGYHRLLPVLSAFGRGVESALRMGLSVQELHRFLHGVYFPLYRRLGVGRRRLNIGLPVALVPFELDIYPCCCCGIFKLGIMPDGDVGLCHLCDGYHRLTAGRVGREGATIRSLWETGRPFGAMRRLRREQLSGVCSRCRFFAVCLGGCRVHALAQYGGFSASDPTCQAFAEAGLFPEESLLAEGAMDR